MKPKVWNYGNPAAQNVASGKLRGLDRVNIPYLRASGPGFAAFKRGDFRELSIDSPENEAELLRLATHDIALREGFQVEVSRAGAKPGAMRNCGENLDGLFIGNACAMALYQGAVSAEGVTKTVLKSFRTTPPPSPAPPAYEDATRTYSQGSAPWGAYLLSWEPPFGVYAKFWGDCRVFDGVGMLQPRDSVFCQIRPCFTGWVAGLPSLMVAFCKRSDAQDDYGFEVARPWLMRMTLHERDAGAALHTLELPLPQDTSGIHSYQVGTPVALRPLRSMLLVAEYFQPQRLLFDEALNPSNPRGRLLIYRSSNDGVAWTVDELTVPEGVLPAAPDADPLSAAIDDPGKEPQHVAWRASTFDCPLNLRMLEFVSGCGVATADGAVLWACSLQESGGYPSLKIFRITDSSAVLVHTVAVAGANSSQKWVDFVYVGPSTLLARVRAAKERIDRNPVVLLVSKDHGQTWQQLESEGLPATLTNSTIGIPSVHRIRSDGKPVVYLPVREVGEGGDRSIVMQSTDDCKTWRRAGMLARLQGAQFVPPISNWYTPTAGSPGVEYDSGYTMGYGRVATVRDGVGRLLPLDQIHPWMLDDRYEAPA